MMAAPFILKVRMLMAEVVETLLPAVRVCNVNPQRETLCRAPKGAPRWSSGESLAFSVRPTTPTSRLSRP